MSTMATKAGASALTALLTLATPLTAEATPFTVTWPDIDTLFADHAYEEFSFSPVSNVFSFLGVDRGEISWVEQNWTLELRLDGNWQTIFTSDQSPGMSSLTEIPGTSFTAGTLDGIRFGTSRRLEVSGFTDAAFSFDRVTAVPEPASLPLFAAALGALGLAFRRRDEAQG